jgi:hypothetical protein
MKNKKRRVIIGLVLLCLLLPACGQKQTEDPYGEVIADLGDDELYAILKMDYKNTVLVTTDLVYDEGSEQQVAIGCEVYYCMDKEAKKLGTVTSDGTAYPVSFSKNGIFVGSGHSVEKYAISEKEGALYLEKGVYIDYDEEGKEHYTCVKNGEETESTEQEYQELLNEYGASSIIHFAYGASDECVNEIPEW